MSEPKYFQAYINPLVFFPLDEDWSAIHNVPLTVQSLLGYLCAPDIDSSIEAVSQRYEVISKQPAQLYAAPAEENILTKLVWPLRNAKASYTLGNYLGTIAICGMVCEMLTIVVFEISDTPIKKQPAKKITSSDTYVHDSSSFEALGQMQRLRILRSHDLIDDPLKLALDIVREKRRLYLHFFSQEHDNIQTDAALAFNATVKALTSVVGQELKANGIMINPKFLKYLESRGAAGSTPSDGVPAAR